MAKPVKSDLCTHDRLVQTTALSGQMRKCGDCGAIDGARGWRRIVSADRDSPGDGKGAVRVVAVAPFDQQTDFDENGDEDECRCDGRPGTTKFSTGLERCLACAKLVT